MNWNFSQGLICEILMLSTINDIYVFTVMTWMTNTKWLKSPFLSFVPCRMEAVAVPPLQRTQDIKCLVPTQHQVNSKCKTWFYYPVKVISHWTTFLLVALTLFLNNWILISVTTEAFCTTSNNIKQFLNPSNPFLPTLLTSSQGKQAHWRHLKFNLFLFSSLSFILIICII